MLSPYEAKGRYPDPMPIDQRTYIYIPEMIKIIEDYSNELKKSMGVAPLPS